MDRATLGGVSGAAEVHSRLRSETDREYRGTFAFRSSDEPLLVQLLRSGEAVEYEGPVDALRGRLQVFVTDLSLERGFAYIQGKGEPY